MKSGKRKGACCFSSIKSRLYSRRAFVGFYVKNRIICALSDKEYIPYTQKTEGFLRFFDCKKIFSVLKFYYGR